MFSTIQAIIALRFTLQGQRKPNAIELARIAEVQPVLATGCKITKDMGKKTEKNNLIRPKVYEVYAICQKGTRLRCTKYTFYWPCIYFANKNTLKINSL